MADLPTTLSFKAPPWMVEWLQDVAKSENRTVGNMIRVLLIKMYEQSREQDIHG